MPELPEVEHIVRYLRPVLMGRRFTDVRAAREADAREVARAGALRKDLRGGEILTVERRGKWIDLELTDSTVLRFHLRMTGKLWWMPANSPIRSDTRLVFLLQSVDGGASELHLDDQRRFARVELLSGADAAQQTRTIGPDALLATTREIRNACDLGRGGLKAQLLDQNCIAGIGNIYADEILFEAKLHPLRRMESLTQRERAGLVKAISGVIHRAVSERNLDETPDQERVGSGKKGVAKRRLKLAVYQCEGEPCGRCGALIVRIKVAGRGTYLCGRCQVSG